jgi:hypothetical protein
MTAANCSLEERSDAPMTTEEAYACIDELFKNKNFLASAQERVHNDGVPFPIEDMSKNFDNIMERWSKKQFISSVYKEYTHGE